jgi:hypothetical protein
LTKHVLQIAAGIAQDVDEGAVDLLEKVYKMAIADVDVESVEGENYVCALEVAQAVCYISLVPSY